MITGLDGSVMLVVDTCPDTDSGLLGMAVTAFGGFSKGARTATQHLRGSPVLIGVLFR